MWDVKAETLHLELTFDNKLFKISALMHPSTYINKVLFGSNSGQMQLWNLNTVKMIYSFKGKWNKMLTASYTNGIISTNINSYAKVAMD